MDEKVKIVNPTKFHRPEKKKDKGFLLHLANSGSSFLAQRLEKEPFVILEEGEFCYVKHITFYGSRLFIVESCQGDEKYLHVVEEKGVQEIPDKPIESKQVMTKEEPIETIANMLKQFQQYEYLKPKKIAKPTDAIPMGARVRVVATGEEGFITVKKWREYGVELFSSHVDAHKGISTIYFEKRFLQVLSIPE